MYLPRPKLRLKFVRVLREVQRAESRKAPHTSPFSRLVLPGIYAQGGHRFPGFEVPEEKMEQLIDDGGVAIPPGRKEPRLKSYLINLVVRSRISLQDETQRKT